MTSDYTKEPTLKFFRENRYGSGGDNDDDDIVFVHCSTISAGSLDFDPKTLFCLSSLHFLVWTLRGVFCYLTDTS